MVHESNRTERPIPHLSTFVDRREWLGLMGCAGLAALMAGCEDPSASSRKGIEHIPELIRIYGKLGNADGRFQKPRAMIVDKKDHLYIVDMTGRVQVFDSEGTFIRLWRTPDITHGKPTGLGINSEGHILVANTHYYQVLFYTPNGELLEEKTIGGTNGQGPGEFGFVTDVVQDREGNYYISEYGDFDRIQKFDSEGNFIFQWGKHGSEPLEFSRPQSMVFDAKGHLWVSDACNHRLQVFACDDNRAELLAIYGKNGKEPGSFRYPYGMAMDRDGHLLISEWGNNRLQRINTQGESLGIWGVPGTKPGQLYQPWAVQSDSKGRIHILDTMNHRVQCIKI